MKITTIIALLIYSGICFGQVAQTPPMGWNSYNCFGSAVHEDEVKANADYMSAHLKQYGWQYVVVDFLWSYDNPPGSTIGNTPSGRTLVLYGAMLLFDKAPEKSG